MPDPVYPHLFPCRINENARISHCGSCELVPDLLARIKALELKIEEDLKVGNFVLELQRDVYGKTDPIDGKEWWSLPDNLFLYVRRLFDHPRLEEVTFSYLGGVDMKFRKKVTDGTSPTNSGSST